MRRSGTAFAERLEARRPHGTAETLTVVLGDQLDPHARVLREASHRTSVVLMVEARAEALHVPSHLQRTILFLSAMRHFALDLLGKSHRIRYVRLDDPQNTQEVGSELRRAIRELGARRVCVTRPGEHRVGDQIRTACRSEGVRLEVSEDESFTCPLDEFDAWADGRKDLILEHFYRTRRRRLGILVEEGKPVGGRWNFDEKNREPFREEPKTPRRYAPREDPVTREVRDLVVAAFPSAPGVASPFRWPVTRDQARRGLDDFVERRLSRFGRYQDAMWTGEPVLFHSTLSPSLNLKLIRPAICVERALAAYEADRAALPDVEGFLRQIIGWREFVRGVYYREDSDYPTRNGLDQEGRLPEFFWTADTDMRCLRHCIGEVLGNAYGHHIQRLMVIGNFALIAGVDPRSVHQWFLGMYVDAVEWVTAPNVIGMSQHADGGIVGTKPYAASGKYIRRMSNYCDGCRYDPQRRTGDDPCPFNTFYWDFLMRHRTRLQDNRRMAMSLRNVDRIGLEEQREIRRRADRLRRRFGVV